MGVARNLEKVLRIFAIDRVRNLGIRVPLDYYDSLATVFGALVQISFAGPYFLPPFERILSRPFNPLTPFSFLTPLPSGKFLEMFFLKIPDFRTYVSFSLFLQFCINKSG